MSLDYLFIMRQVICLFVYIGNQSFGSCKTGEKCVYGKCMKCVRQKALVMNDAVIFGTFNYYSGIPFYCGFVLEFLLPFSYFLRVKVPVPESSLHCCEHLRSQ